MYKIFCCRSNNATRVEVDEITDSLEKCLSTDRGIHEFKNFLEKNRFDEESKTLTFSLKCQNILGEISRLSPSTRSQELPHKIQNDIRNIYELANDVNFDLDQMNNLRNLYSSDVDKKVMGKRKIRIRR